MYMYVYMYIYTLLFLFQKKKSTFQPKINQKNQPFKKGALGQFFLFEKYFSQYEYSEKYSEKYFSQYEGTSCLKI